MEIAAQAFARALDSRPRWLTFQVIVLYLDSQEGEKSMTTQRRILWTVTDPRGLVVTLTEDTWEHAVRRHGEIADYLEQARLAVEMPDEIYYDPKSTESRTTGAKVYWYLKTGLLTGKLAEDYMAVVVKVVVEEGDSKGYVSTALPIDKPMKRLVLEWKKN